MVLCRFVCLSLSRMLVTEHRQRISRVDSQEDPRLEWVKIQKPDTIRQIPQKKIDVFRMENRPKYIDLIQRKYIVCNGSY
jgi:hypothetical protein